MSLSSTQKSFHKLAWHYTIGQHFLKISESGVLMPSNIGVIYPEKPIIWFSTHPYWEPTACKGAILDGKRITLSMIETLKVGGGLIRIGLPVNKLHHWDKLKKKARISAEMIKQLERVAIEQGAKPSQWHGVTTAIKIEKCIKIQVMNDELIWSDI